MHSGLRHLTIALLAVVVTLSAFYLMQQLVGTTTAATVSNTTTVIAFTDVKPPEPPAKEPRQPPPPPPKPTQPPPPPKMPAVTPEPPVVPPLVARFGPVDTDSSVSTTLWNPGDTTLHGHQDGEIIPLVRIQPAYPRAAAVKRLEGWVTVRFTITAAGLVRDPVVVDGNPRGVFDATAKRTILKWKFKPRIIDGIATQRQASQRFDFSLEQG